MTAPPQRASNYRAPVICARPGCGEPLNARQKYNRNRYCCRRCARLRFEQLFPEHQTAPTPAPVFTERWIGGEAPPPPPQIELLIERGYRYFRWETPSGVDPDCVMFERGEERAGRWTATARPFVYCAWSQWEQSSAYRRAAEGAQHAEHDQLARLAIETELKGWAM